MEMMIIRHGENGTYCKYKFEECVSDDKYTNNTAYYATGDYLCHFIIHITRDI